MEIIERRINQRKAVIDSAREFSRNLNFKCTAVLIGSYARGDFNLWSDVDLLIISDFKENNPVDRLRSIDFPPGYEIIPLNVREVEKMCSKGSKFIQDAFREGVVLRDDLGIINRGN